MGSGVVQGDGGGGCAHAPQIATALAKTLDIKRILFMVRVLELASITCHTQHPMAGSVRTRDRTIHGAIPAPAD
jgi:hypothetical protein